MVKEKAHHAQSGDWGLKKRMAGEIEASHPSRDGRQGPVPDNGKGREEGSLDDVGRENGGAGGVGNDGVFLGVGSGVDDARQGRAGRRPTEPLPIRALSRTRAWSATCWRYCSFPAILAVTIARLLYILR